MISKVMQVFFSFLDKLKIFDLFIVFYKFHLKYWIKKAEGRVIIKTIKNTGTNCLIHGSAIIHYPDNLKIDDHVRIGDGAFIFAKGGVAIGKNSQISRNVLIYSANHNINGSAIPYDNTYSLKSVCIGSSVWIGMNVVITPGVKIGDGAIVGMGTVISKDVPAGAIVVGQSQRIIKYRDMNLFNLNDEEKKLFGMLWPDL